MSSSQTLLSFFKVFLPSWKFFDEAGSQPELRWRIGESPWQAALRPTPRRISQIFLNPQGNLRHALDSMVERLLQEAANADPKELPETVSYKLVVNCVRQLIRWEGPIPQERKFQFKITGTYPDEQDLLISKEHEV